MKLQLIAEDTINDYIKRGEKLAQKELQELTDDPIGCYTHILRGITYPKKAIIYDKKYWDKMFAFWVYIPEKVKIKFFEEITEKVVKQLEQLQKTGQFQEGLGQVISNSVSWVGKQITKFAMFMTQLSTVLAKHGVNPFAAMGGSQGKRGQSSQQPKTTQSYANLVEKYTCKINANATISFVDKCIVYSKNATKTADADEEIDHKPEKINNFDLDDLGPDRLELDAADEKEIDHNDPDLNLGSNESYRMTDSEREFYDADKEQRRIKYSRRHKRPRYTTS